MTKKEFILYISKDNPGFYKTRKNHIAKNFPNILEEINDFISKNNLEPINFNDSLNYYLNDIKEQSKCICGKNIHSKHHYCSNKCKKLDIKNIVSKSKKTLLEKNGSLSPLGSIEAKQKRKDTCLKKYGVDHPSKNLNVKNKIQKSNKKTYKDDSLKKKIGLKISESYKNNNESIIKKRKQTNLEKYGEFKILPSKIIKKAKNTLLEKYNTKNPFLIHENTYELAKLGSIKFYNDQKNKKLAIQKRINTIISKYGSLEKMNEKIFLKKKEKILQNIIDLGFKDKIVKYDYTNLGNLQCKCNKNHIYDISLRLLRERIQRNDIICTKCSPPLTKWISNAQIELYNWISNYIKCEYNNKKVLNGQEIDIYIPDKKIGIEFNGIYWHSDLFKDKNYHLNKTIFAKEQGIKLIHIWEDLWISKKEIIKSRILSNLNINSIVIGARKCNIKEINASEANIFYEKNHLQGKTKGSKHIALFYNNEIVSCLSIGNRKIGKNNKNNLELLRFCNKLNTNVQGSFSKLFKYLNNKYLNDEKIISYADLSWGEGNVYKNAGFILKEYSKPNYWYFIDGKRFHRYTFNKQKLIKMGYEKNKTEFQIMNEDLKSLRLYDCGNAIWELN